LPTVATLIATQRDTCALWLRVRELHERIATLPSQPPYDRLVLEFRPGQLYIRTAIGTFGDVRRDLEAAAAVNGAGPMRIFRFTPLPLASAPLTGGAVMTWARALGEFGATILFVGNLQGVTQTMPRALYRGFEQNLEAALTFSILLLFVSFAVLFLAPGILRQRTIDVARRTDRQHKWCYRIRSAARDGILWAVQACYQPPAQGVSHAPREPQEPVC
jgi:hypothetical protein